MKILVVDDEPLLRLTTARILRSANYKVLEATTSEECLQICQTQHPEIVLLDVVLGSKDKSGLEICKILKSDPLTQDMLVVFVSGIKKTSIDQAEGLEEGGDDFIARPFERREFLARIKALVRLKNTEQALRQTQNALEEKVKARTLELEQANIHLRELAKMKDEFLATISHELRTPLSTILMGVEALQDLFYGALTERQIKILHRIYQNGEHLLVLINDILDISKLESGRLELEFKPVSPRLICQNCLSLIQEQIQRKHLHIEVHFDPEAHSFHADERRLKQILLNLLSNAVKFTPEGGHIGLEFQCDPLRKQIRFTVWDTGIGIPKTAFNNLFQPFTQVKCDAHSQQEGTGLGLALVKGLTDLHGGSVSVTSHLNQGSRFIINLPWWEDDLSLKIPTPDSSLPTENSASVLFAKMPLILVVEDHQANREMICDYLSCKGYQVIKAIDGAEAVKLARQFHPDAIFMDVQMPGMIGLEATRHIRADPELAAIPIIALTALVMPNDRERCLAAGMDEYLGKPVELKKMVKVLEKILSQTKKKTAEPITYYEVI